MTMGRHAGTWALALVLVLPAGCVGRVPNPQDGTASFPATAAPPEAGGSADLYIRRGRMEGGIAVNAALALPEYFTGAGAAEKAAELGAADFILVELEFETHSSDLTEYDPLQNAVLITAAGAPVTPLTWVSRSDDSHHRKGYLRFGRQAGTEPLLPAEWGRITLELRNLGGVPVRTYQWDFPLVGATG